MATRKVVKKAKTAKIARPAKKSLVKKTAKKPNISKPFKPEMTPEEVRAIEIQVNDTKKAEKSWLTMTDTSPEDDTWADAEERLVRKPAEAQHAARSWKHFSK